MHKFYLNKANVKKFIIRYNANYTRPKWSETYFFMNMLKKNAVMMAKFLTP